jgi:hypothetical protein
MSRRGLFYVDDESAVLPGARSALADVRARGLAHRYVRHVRSSQAFALNLFAPLDEKGLRNVFTHLGQRVVTVEPPFFEFEDVKDRLREASVRSPHRTQVDVLLRGINDEGHKVAALIEVKFTETNFGGCSAATSPENPSLEVCSQAGLFGGAPEKCFQLQNHGYGQRKYAEYLSGLAVTPPAPREDSGGCYVRQGRSQPMRNLAMAHLLVREGDYDEVAFAVCAPIGHVSMWRRFAEFSSMFPSTNEVAIFGLEAETVLRYHRDGGDAFAARYVPALSDTALLHLETDGSELLGVWVSRGGLPTSYYPDDGPNEQSKHRPYGENVVTDEDWHSLVERLPASSPYVAWWESVECSFLDSAEDVFTRIKSSRF